MRERLARGIIRGAGGGGGSTSTGKDDFESYALGSGLPSGGSELYSGNDGVASIEEDGTDGPHFLRLSSDTTDDRFFVVLDEVGDEPDVEVYAEVRYSNATASFQVTPVILRASGSAGSENAYRYGIQRDSGGGEFSAIQEYISGSSGGVNFVAKTWSDGVWYSVLAQAIGTDLRVKFWERGTTEPSSWDVTAVDSALTSGRVGLNVFNAANDLDCDFFSYSLDPQNTDAPRS